MRLLKWWRQHQENKKILIKEMTKIPFRVRIGSNVGVNFNFPFFVPTFVIQTANFVLTLVYAKKLNIE